MRRASPKRSTGELDDRFNMARFCLDASLLDPANLFVDLAEVVPDRFQFDLAAAIQRRLFEIHLSQFLNHLFAESGLVFRSSEVELRIAHVA